MVFKKMATSSKRSRSDCGLVAPLGWFSDEESDEEASKKHSKKNERFSFKSTTDIESLSTVKPPKTTSYTTAWAVRNFEAWKFNRNVAFPDKQVHANLLQSGSSKDLSHWLSFFVSETRNCSGERYPPKTLYQLLSGLLRHARSSNDQTPDFLDKTSTFKPFHAVLDNLFKMLRQDGIGNDSKHAELVSKDEERQLWDAGVMGTSDPKSLLRAVFYFNGKNFCLRGGQEHRCLKLSQFCRLTVPCNHYVYTENAFKNRPGGLAQLRLENKTVPIYANLDAGERCHVSLRDKYISKLPAETVKSDFFLCPPTCQSTNRSNKILVCCNSNRKEYACFHVEGYVL